MQVLGGRHFPSFSEGDVGKVVYVDREALNCEVIFEGSGGAVPVALRHLKLVRAPSTPTRSRGATPKRWEDREVWEMAASKEVKALADARKAAERRAEALFEGRRTASERQELSRSRPHDRESALDDSNAGSPDSCAGLPVADSDRLAEEEAEQRARLLECRRMKDVTPEKSQFGVSGHTSTAGGESLMSGTAEYETCDERLICDVDSTRAEVKAVSTAGAREVDWLRARVDSLTGQLAAAERRHGSEMEALRRDTEKALELGSQQAARIDRLECELRSLWEAQDAGEPASTSCAPVSVPASPSVPEHDTRSSWRSLTLPAHNSGAAEMFDVALQRARGGSLLANSARRTSQAGRHRSGGRQHWNQYLMSEGPSSTGSFASPPESSVDAATRTRPCGPAVALSAEISGRTSAPRVVARTSSASSFTPALSAVPSAARFQTDVPQEVWPGGEELSSPQGHIVGGTCRAGGSGVAPRARLARSQSECRCSGSGPTSPSRRPAEDMPSAALCRELPLAASCSLPSCPAQPRWHEHCTRGQTTRSLLATPLHVSRCVPVGSPASVRAVVGARGVSPRRPIASVAPSFSVGVTSGLHANVQAVVPGASHSRSPTRTCGGN